MKKKSGLSAQQERELASWLQADARHAAVFSQLELLDQTLDAISDKDKRSLVRQVKSELSPSWMRLASWRHWFSAGVTSRLSTAMTCLLIVCCLGFSIDYYLKQPEFTQHLVTAKGESMAQPLPDGSSIHLDTDTALEVVLYRTHRDIRLLHGQAMFSVSADAHRPFHVMAGSSEVTVVGTQFSVRYLDGRVVVAVQAGHVRVAGIAQQHGNDSSLPATDLVAQQSVTFAGDGTVSAIRPIALENIAPWREGRIVFNNTPLADAVREFERYSMRTIQLADSKAGNLRISGSFQYKKLDSFLGALPEVLPVKVVTKPSSVIIRSN